MALDRDGNILVCDEKNHRVQLLQCDGTFITSFGEYGGDQLQLDCPISVCVGVDGKVYVTEYGSKRTQVVVFD